MKNKKIIARILALSASLLLVVALAVPCFAAGVVSEESYCVKTITFTDRQSALTWLLDNNYNVISGVLSADLLEEPMVFNNVEMSDYGVTSYARFTKMAIGADSTDAVLAGISIIITTQDTLVTMSPIELNFNEDGTFTMSGDAYTNLPDAYWEQVNTSLTVYYYEEFTPTVAPIDPDAPTRTGLYGELYHIIRDAIYGDNALLDSTQEFTLTQIATVMTYAVLLLPFIVVAIIFFKLVRL